jgi:hypothetical protein
VSVKFLDFSNLCIEAQIQKHVEDDDYDVADELTQKQEALRLEVEAIEKLLSGKDIILQILLHF